MKIARVLILSFFLFHLTIASRAADNLGANDPNAAVRYLMALGWFIPPPKSVDREFSRISDFAELKNQSSSAQEYLDNSAQTKALQLLKRGGACPNCSFNPDSSLSDDSIPPYERLEQLARFANVSGGMRARDGNFSEAVDLFIAIYQLGQHLEEDGQIYSAMVGYGLRKNLALVSMKNLLGMNPPPEVRTKLMQFLNALPNPVLGSKRILERERVIMINFLREVKSRPALLQGFILVEASGTQKLTRNPEKMCQENQITLTRALLALQQDFDPLPATVTANLKTALLAGHYLDKFPVCPGGGRLGTTHRADGKLICVCSKHASWMKSDSQNPDVPEDSKGMREFVNSPEYDRLVAELVSLYSEGIALDQSDPDYLRKAAELGTRVETSDNVLIKTIIPNFAKILECQKKLDELINDLKN
ncbi:MAG: hypothetical protein HQM09_06220 [Candidatus Riflebacteria bacterium]|nr:hypothetical protein [Candidatus Riflebacteria bacterium]